MCLECRLPVFAYVTQELNSAQDKPVLDAGSFQQLLAAAYVVQAHNDRLAGRKRKPDATNILAEIAETQRLIQSQQLDLDAATKLIAERLQKVTNASGVAVGMVDGDLLAYRAATGSAAGETGSRVAFDSCLAADCLRNGQILQCPNVKKNSLPSAELCRERGVKSLIAAPVYHEGRVAGVLELRFAKASSFQEHDIRTSQLMAGLVTEAIARAADQERKQALATERASMLEALGRIKPQVERLVGEPAATAAPPSEADPPALPVEPAAVSNGEGSKTVSTGTICSGCGHRFEEGEFFCGICGTARLGISSSDDIERKWELLRQRRQPAESREKEGSVQQPEAAADLPNQTVKPAPAPLEEIVAQSSADKHKIRVPESTTTQATAMLPPSLDEILARFATAETAAIAGESPLATHDGADSAAEVKGPLPKTPADFTRLSELAQTSVWTSAAKAREWLESLKTQHPRWTEFWRRHRANIYLGIAVVILQIVILLLVLPGGGKQPAASGNSMAAGNVASAANPRRRRTPPQPQLTLFEKLLVSLGLAEPPPTPAYLGTPGIRVWVDTHTALYYCPGSDFYGKTPGGKFTTQLDAQQDQFEPANRKACD